MRGLIAILIVLPLILSAQDLTMSSKRYKDKFRFVPEPGEEVVRTWFHYVVSKTSEGQWVARTFYPEAGRLTDLTSYADENCTIRSGRTFHWFDDGSEAYSGEFDGDLRVGVWSERSDSGRYEQGKREGVWRLPSSKSGRERGLLVGGVREGVWTTTDSLGRKISERSFKKGRLDGDWTNFSALSGDIESRWVYRADTLFDGNRQLVEHIEHMPYLKHCQLHDTDKRRGYCTDSLIMVTLRENLRYPKEAQEKQVTGRALIEFVVNKDGSISGIKAQNGLCAAIEAECLRVIQKMPEWEPGEQRDMKVSVLYHQSIKFSLR
ncbi:MAG: energy transducer TonB [Flavobacteriales bacterium]|nr:energy transducer TonB [Flavobacteriales bacterium]